MIDVSELEGKVHVGDCLPFMRGLPDGCVDLVLTDPDYLVGREYGHADSPEPEEWFSEALRVGETLVFTPGIGNVWRYPVADWIICWYKPATMLRGKCGSNAWEPVLVYGKREARGGCDVIQAVLEGQHSDAPWHPTPKPKKLWAKLVADFTQANDLVFDPFLGSGTTAVVCERLGRRWIGCEINPDYAAMAEKRIQRERDKLQLPFEVKA